MKQAGNRLFPSSIEGIRITTINIWFKPFFQFPAGGKFIWWRADARGKPRQIGRTKRRGFGYNRTIHRRAKLVRSHLHRPVIGNHAAINAQNRFAFIIPIGAHRLG